MGMLLSSCAEVHEPIDLSFGEVNEVGPGIGVLHGVHMLQGKWAVSGAF